MIKQQFLYSFHIEKNLGKPVLSCWLKEEVKTKASVRKMREMGRILKLIAKNQELQKEISVRILMAVYIHGPQLDKNTLNNWQKRISVK